ncbi:MAG TPA: hypothetical protein VES88_15905 [Gemmatimonadaceae bacterium]|nr:hypothetical protein [Gemmatimonadaceae bacterium]
MAALPALRFYSSRILRKTRRSQRTRDFLEELVDVAEELKTFAPRANGLTLNAYLASMRPRRGNTRTLSLSS